MVRALFLREVRLVCERLMRWPWSQDGVGNSYRVLGPLPRSLELGPHSNVILGTIGLQ